MLNACELLSKELDKWDSENEKHRRITLDKLRCHIIVGDNNITELNFVYNKFIMDVFEIFQINQYF